MESVVTIAYYLIKKAKEEKASGATGAKTNISPLKLQKLLYFAQGIYLINYDEPLFEEPIQAWDYGPVVPTLWQHLKSKGITNENLVTAISDAEIDDKVGELGNKYKVFLDEFFTVYAVHTTSKLVSATHNHKIWQEAHRSFDNRIPIDKIKEYFRTL